MWRKSQRILRSLLSYFLTKFLRKSKRLFFGYFYFLISNKKRKSAMAIYRLLVLKRMISTAESYLPWPWWNKLIAELFYTNLHNANFYLKPEWNRSYYNLIFHNESNFITLFPKRSSAIVVSIRDERDCHCSFWFEPKQTLKLQVWIYNASGSKY